MTADEFIAWSLGQGTGRYELEDGLVVHLSAEQAAHARVKHRAARLLEDAIARAGIPCEVFPDGMAVIVDATSVYEPDALVRCGPSTPGHAVRITDPVIVVEVSSPSTGGRDAGIKFLDYFRLPSLRHYLLLYPERRAAVHHARPEGGDGDRLPDRDGGCPAPRSARPGTGPRRALRRRLTGRVTPAGWCPRRSVRPRAG